MTYRSGRAIILSVEKLVFHPNFRSILMQYIQTKHSDNIGPT